MFSSEFSLISSLFPLLNHTLNKILSLFVIARKNSWHLATLLLAYPANLSEKQAVEIPYWWRITTQIWVVLLIGWIKFLTWHDQFIRSTTQIWVVRCHQYEISALVSQTSFGGETNGSVTKCWPFSQAIMSIKKGKMLNDSILKNSLTVNKWELN